jgi:tetratricopeptide (TPR) repeat protein
MAMTRTPWLLALTLVTGVLAGPAGAQAAGPDEVTLLAEATGLEDAGDLAGAEALLRAIAGRRPPSAPALLGLERVLRQQGRLDELPPLVLRGLAAEPRSALLNQLLLRTYAALDLPSDIEVAAAAWLDVSPLVEVPYREIARTWESLGSYDRARRVLEEGRRRVAGDDVLALELGALYAGLGEAELAAAEWARAIGPDGRGASQVRRAVQAVSDGGAAIIPALVATFEGDGATPAQRMAGVDLAIAAGLEESALPLAQRALAAMGGGERRSALLQLARRADGAGMPRLAHWAFTELAGIWDRDGGTAIRERADELARALGERPAAGGSSPAHDAGADEPGSRHASVFRIERLAAQDPAAAALMLREFQDRYRTAPELDRLAALVAEAFVGEDASAAAAVVAGVRGPRSTLVRGRIALARGDRDEARAAFLSAAPDLTGAEATQVLALATLVGRVSDGAAPALARALADAAAGEPGAGLDRLRDAAARLGADDRTAVLSFGAALAETEGLDADAVTLRRVIVTEYPRSAEAPAALLALARSVVGDDRTEARELLERLILEHPRSALVPQARRELDRIGRAGQEAMQNQSPGR